MGQKPVGSRSSVGSRLQRWRLGGGASCAEELMLRDWGGSVLTAGHSQNWRGKEAQDAAMTTIGVYRLGCRTRTGPAHWGLGPWSPDKRLVPTGPEKHKGKPLPSDAGQPWGS